MEKGNQCVGMKECKSDTVAIPPMVERSSAVNPPSISKIQKHPTQNLGLF